VASPNECRFLPLINRAINKSKLNLMHSCILAILKTHEKTVSSFFSLFDLISSIILLVAIEYWLNAYKKCKHLTLCRFQIIGAVFLFMQCLFAINVAFAYRYVCLVKTHWQGRFLSRTVQVAIQVCVLALSISVAAGWYFAMWDNSLRVGADTSFSWQILYIFVIF
jgi:hypothetical protein